MRPNILMLFPDQWRGDWLGAISDLPLRTPNIDALIERGVSFGRAWTPSPLCAPARSCFATGKHYGRAPVVNNSMDNPPNTPTFYARLRDGGYQVANAGKSDLLKGAHSWGVDGRHVVNGVDQLAQLGFTHGFDSAGKKAAEKAYADGYPEPYTDMLKRRGLIDRFMADYAHRSVGKEKMPMSDWIGCRVHRPPEAYANVVPVDLPEDAYNDNFVGKAADELIRDFDPARPWFLIVNFPGPHEPMDVTAEMAACWKDVTFPLPHLRDNSDAELQQDIRRRYAAMLENVDRWLGVYIDTLRGLGQLGRTLIVFASDHGEMLGDRNLWKKQVPYEASVRVPLVVAGPGVRPQGHLPKALASLLDLPVTLLSQAGIAVPDDYEGQDLSGVLKGEGLPEGRTVISGLGGWRSITDGRYKLLVGFRTDVFQEGLQFGSLTPEAFKGGLLFDLDRDPLETDNLWAAAVTVRDRLLEQLLAATGSDARQ
jgi:arylsulfatase A-like enzyme